MKKILSFLLIAAIMLSGTTAFAAELPAELDTQVCSTELNRSEDQLDTAFRRPIATVGTLDESGSGGKGVNVSQNITINGGKSKSYNFKMNNLFADPHSAFNVRINNVSSGSKYTLSITYDGVELWNQQYTGSAAVNVTNCSQDQKWIVLIINDRSQAMSCDVEITSF